MKEPYADDPTTHGIRLTPYPDLAALVQEADAAALQVRFYVSLLETAVLCCYVVASFAAIWALPSKRHTVF